MGHRVLEIAWVPRTSAGWRTFSGARKEAARLWNDLVERHHRIRRLNWKWPSQRRWETWAKGRYPWLSAQAVQQLIGEFCEAVKSAKQLRKNGQAAARYPWRKRRHHDITYTNQDAKIRDGKLRLPNGKAGALLIPIPSAMTLPGRLMEVHLSFGAVRLCCEVPDVPRPADVTVGVDLGVNTLIAATDGKKALLISGRGAKATVQWRAKKLAELSSAQSEKLRGSRRYKRLQRRKYRMLDKARNRIRDLTHKATRAVVNAFPNAKVFVGEPFNDAAQRLGRRQAQQVSSACNRKIIAQLDYKTSGAIEVPEAYSSQTCPVCGRRNKCRRTYRCRCGCTAPRDMVGGLNIRTIGIIGKLKPNKGLKMPTTRGVHPSKYPGTQPGNRLARKGRQVVPAEPRQVAREKELRHFPRSPSL